jgi:hypothetical protein
MADNHILLQMTLEKNRMIEEVIARFLGHKPSWKERKLFSVMHSLEESSVYYKGECIGTVRYETVHEPII